MNFEFCKAAATPRALAIYVEKKERKGRTATLGRRKPKAVVRVLLADLNSCYLVLIEGTCFWYQMKAHAISNILILSFWNWLKICYSRAKSKRRKLLIPHPVFVKIIYNMTLPVYLRAVHIVLCILYLYVNMIVKYTPRSLTTATITAITTTSASTST